MLACAEVDGSISRYRVTIKCCQWLRAPDLDKMLEELNITKHKKQTSWKGEYYEAKEVVEALYNLKEELNTSDKLAIKDKLNTKEGDPW